jgi:hypothetical protein
MSQRSLHSLVEALLNTASGFIVSMGVGPVVFPLFNFHPTLAENTAIVAIYTAISIVRSYIWRRLFNWLHTTGRLA